MWIVHRVLRSGYAIASKTGVFSTSAGQATYEFLYERFKLSMEGETIRNLRNYIKEDSLVIDVGANIGIYTNVFKKSVGNSGKVVAIEADPTNASSLRRRFSSESRIDVIESAATDRSGTCRLQQDPYNPAGHVLSIDGIEVSSVTVDEIVDRYKLPLSLIKIDVEGAEQLVIQGATKSIKKYMPALFIEYSPDRITRLGGNPRELLRTFREFGYEFFVDDWSLPLSIDEIDQKATQVQT